MFRMLLEGIIPKYHSVSRRTTLHIAHLCSCQAGPRPPVADFPVIVLNRCQSASGVLDDLDANYMSTNVQKLQLSTYVIVHICRSVLDSIGFANDGHTRQVRLPAVPYKYAFHSMRQSHCAADSIPIELEVHLHNAAWSRNRRLYRL